MDGQEEMTKDPLFLAVTRPALWAGVPIEAGALIIMAGAITLVGSGNPLYGGAAAVALYAMARLIVRHAVNAFRLIFLWGRTKAVNRTRVFKTEERRVGKRGVSKGKILVSPYLK